MAAAAPPAPPIGRGRGLPPEPPPLRIDLRTKVIPPNARLWALFPGLARRYLRTFIEHSVVFLDTPGIALSVPVLADFTQLRRHVAMSEAIVEYHRGARRPPSRNPNTYELRGPRAVSTAAYVRHLFVDVQVGDIIAVGGQMYDPVYYGEVITATDGRNTIRVPRYGDEDIPVRRVRWHPSIVERRYLSPDLSHLLSNRKALTELSKIRFGAEMFSSAYGNYIVDDESRYAISGDNYDNNAPSLIAPINVISYFIAAWNAIESEDLDNFFEKSLYEAAQQFYDNDLLKSLQVEFSSPGQFVIAAKRAALPLFVALCLQAAINGVSLDTARAAEVTNSTAPADPCTVEVKEKYQYLMNGMQYDRWQQVCHEAQKAKQGINLNPRLRPPSPARQ